MLEQCLAAVASNQNTPYLARPAAQRGQELLVKLAALRETLKLDDKTRFVLRHAWQEGAQNMSGSNADRNVLFGVLAVQNSFVDRDVLVQGMNAWVQDKSKSLGQILLERHVLDPETRDLLESLTEEHLKHHEQETEKSLATIGWTESLRQDLLKIAGYRRAADGDPPGTARNFGIIRQPPAVDDRRRSAGRRRAIPHPPSACARRTRRGVRRFGRRTAP